MPPAPWPWLPRAALSIVALPMALAIVMPVAVFLAPQALAQQSSAGPASGSREIRSQETGSKETGSKEMGAKSTTGSGKESNGAVVDSKMEILRQKLKTDKKYIVSENMDLTEDEAKNFWPLYDSYQKDLAKINQRIRDLASTYIAADARGPISEQLSKKLVSESLDIERAELEAKKTMLAKLSKVLPAYKVARYGQMENKMRALVKYELAVNIPLIE